jgi:ubiquinone/menaquinone biosynthesis C-methylase UbiE
MTGPEVSTGAPGDGYALGRTSAEYQRLRWQAALFEQVTARVLGQLGVGEGLRCLDVGCGAGDVMRLLAGLVGPAGAVTGLDSDARLGGEALAVLRATVPGRFAFVEADVETAEEVPGGPFDLVFARFLLFHVHDPAAVVRKLYGWTRPGGVLLIQDFDARTMDVVPPLATWPEYERVVYGMFARAGADPGVGRKLPLHFTTAGLGLPDGTDVTGLLLPLPEIVRMYRAMYENLRPAALRLGLTTEADGDAFLAELSEATTPGHGQGAGPGDRTAMPPLVVSAWKQKPRP